MAVSIVSSRTISGDTFYRNKPFDISFSIASSIVADASISFCNSTFGIRPYTSGSNFASSNVSPGTGFSNLGSAGVLSVDAVVVDPQFVTTATPPDYSGARGMCTDPSGNLYFAVRSRHQIWKLDTSGTISVFAGLGISGYTNGDQYNARFTLPQAIATDGSGTFYVSELTDIRKIAPNGIVSTFAGVGGSSGFIDGTGTSARFSNPTFLVVRSDGSLYVSDTGNHAIRLITGNGVVTTYAGTGIQGFANGTIGRYTFPGSVIGVGGFGRFQTSNGSSWTYSLSGFSGTGIAFDGSAVLYTGSFDDGAVVKRQVDVCSSLVTSDVSLTTVLTAGYSDTTFLIGGSGPSGVIQTSTNQGATWATPTGTFPSVAVSSVASSNSIWMATGIGANPVIYSLDSGATWTADAGALSAPGVVRYGGGLWVIGGSPEAYPNSNIAYSASPGGTWSFSTAFSGGYIQALAYGNGLWIAGSGSGTSPPLQYSADAITWTDCSITATPYVVTSIHYSSNLARWFASFSDSLLTIATSTDGSNWTTTPFPNSFMNAMTDVSWTGFPSGSARFDGPQGLVLDASQTLYVADQGNARIRAISGSTATTYAGTGVIGNASGSYATAQFAYPTGLARDTSGALYVADPFCNVIRKLFGGSVTTYTGTFGTAGTTNGRLSNALYNGAYGLQFVGNDLYVSEDNGADVRKITRYPELRPNTPREPSNGTIIATSNYPITVNSRIDVCWTSIGGLLQLYKFEPFSNTFTAKTDVSGDTMTYTSTSTELLGYMTGTGTSQAAFRGLNGATTAYSYLLNLSVQANSNGSVVDDVSTSVRISPARLVYSPCNANLVFYRNEPISPVAFSILCNAASNIYSATTVPTGLSFGRTASNTFALSGTPTTQTIGSNYTILGQDTSGRTYTTQVSMLVNPERLVIDVSGSTTITGVTSNAPIAPVTFTSRFPPYTGLRAITYSWFPAPPAGIQFRDICGNAVFGLSQTISSINDPSFSLTLSGTITEAQLRTFAFTNQRTYTMSLTGSRSLGGTPLSPSLPITITFSNAPVIFFTSNIPPIYVNLPVSNWSYTANAYFADVSVTNIQITSGFLPDGTTGTFNPITQTYTISGTPTTATTYDFTLLATAGSLTASLPVTYTTVPDSISITSTADTCFNFIQYRPMSNGKEGFYPSNITYTVTATSGRPTTFTGSGLPTGVSFDASGNQYTLAGVPLTVAGLTTATLTASVPASGVTATRSLLYSVSAERFTFDPSSATYSFIQNVPIAPKTISATTFSEQPILRYSATGLPPTLTITNTGILTGTVEGSSSGSFQVSAFTAYSSGSNTYSYSVSGDAVLLVPSVYSVTTAPGCNVSIPITGYSLSAKTVSNYRFQTPFAYGLSVNATSGLLAGTLSSSLPDSTTFTILGSAGLVDGSLGGTMITNNLTVNRAQILRNEYANFFPDVSTLFIYSSDDNGATWSKAYDTSGNVYALTIGTNGSNRYLVPTSSNFVLVSSNGASYSQVQYDASSNVPYATSIVNKPGTTTWWMIATRATGPSTRGTFLYTSSNDGSNWTVGSEITTGGFTARDKNSTAYGPSTSTWSPYLNGGAALAYQDGVLLLGGSRILRSTDDGQTWSTVAGGFQKEVGYFSLDQGTVWVATGSDTYETLSNDPWSGTTAKTICYSIDKGLTWTYATGGFNMNGYGITYGNGAWIAYGLCNSASVYSMEARLSFDGATWSALTALPTFDGPSGGLFRPEPLRYGPIAVDETEWKVMVPGSNDTIFLYSHPYDTPLTFGWTATDVSGSFTAFGANTNLASYVAQTIDPGADVTTITFPLPNNGPAFVSPAQSTFVVWQYMPVPTIRFSAVGTNPISYFISTLPVGLTWDSTTQSVSGSCMRTGTQTFTVYAKDGAGGITSFPVTMIVDVPRIVKKQTSAGAYTSLVRQYTEVNAAQTARDSRALPSQTDGIGEFASPYPPSVVTPSNCPC